MQSVLAPGSWTIKLINPSAGLPAYSTTGCLSCFDRENVPRGVGPWQTGPEPGAREPLGGCWGSPSWAEAKGATSNSEKRGWGLECGSSDHIAAPPRKQERTAGTPLKETPKPPTRTRQAAEPVARRTHLQAQPVALRRSDGAPGVPVPAGPRGGGVGRRESCGAWPSAASSLGASSPPARP